MVQSNSAATQYCAPVLLVFQALIMKRAMSAASGHTSLPKHSYECSDDGDDDACSIDDVNECMLCQEPGVLADKSYNGFHFCGQCMKAIRNKQRQFKGNMPATEKDKTRMKTHPAAWRASTIHSIGLFYRFTDLRSLIISDFVVFPN
jgi:hypothetical protein